MTFLTCMADAIPRRALGGTIILLSCNMYADQRPCSDLNYLPGERYRVTIGEPVPTDEEPEPNCMVIQKGESYEFEVANTGEDLDGCTRAAIVDEVPEFMQTFVDNCEPAADL